jgi:hypothetical protein
MVAGEDANWGGNVSEVKEGRFEEDIGGRSSRENTAEARVAGAGGQVCV